MSIVQIMDLALCSHLVYQYLLYLFTLSVQNEFIGIVNIGINYPFKTI